MPTTIAEMKDFYRAERLAHIALVNDFAKKIGLSFPNHDMDKIADPALSEIAPFVWYDYHNRPAPDPWMESHRLAIKRHKKSNFHHPEHWENIGDMTEIAIMEMCCDWSAVSKSPNHGTEYPTATDFYERFALPAYGFGPPQRELITRLLRELNG